MDDVPIVELLTVVTAFLGCTFASGELYDVNRQIRLLRRVDPPDSVDLFAAGVFRRLAWIVFAAQLVLFVTGIYVIGWRIDHPSAVTWPPAQVRSATILLMSIAFAVMSLFFRLDRLTMKGMRQTKDAARHTMRTRSTD